MARESEFSMVLDRIVGDFRSLRERAKKLESKVVPFGQVVVPANRVFDHFQKLTTEQRAEAMKDPKTREAVLEELRKDV